MKKDFNINSVKFGALKSPYDIRDYKANRKIAKAEVFPEEFELSMVRIKNQQNVGSCVAHSLSEVVEYFNSIQQNDTEEMSVGYIYGNRDNSTYKGEGMYTRLALQNLVEYGDVKKELFPYNKEVPEIIELYNNQKAELSEKAKPFAITSYYRVRTAEEIKSALMNHGPIVFAINWYNDMKLDKDAVMTTNKVGYAGGHCMVIYGWNEKGWKVWNSWGTSYGKKGTFIYPFEYSISEAWGVIDLNTENSEYKEEDIIKPNWNEIIAKIINAVVNFFAKLIDVFFGV